VKTTMTAALGVFLLGVAPAAVPPAGTAPRRYTVLLAGNRAGVETVEEKAKGERQIHFEFNDRGRGPGIDERISLDSRGWPSAIELRGHDYYKGAVEERLSRQDGRSIWQSDVENGEAPEGSGFYLAFNGAPEEASLLAAALLRAPDRTLPLLPAGRASIEPAGEVTVRRDGVERRVSQYAVTGLDFSPTRVWLDADGTYFASVSPWTTVVREGWEDAVASLSAAQDAAGARRGTELVSRLAHRFPSIAFTHVALFDSTRAALVPATTVVVAEGRIRAVGPDGKVPIPSDAERIDAAGKTLLPGLWDMHVHLSSGDGPLQIANGITTVRDMGNDPDALLAWKKQFDEGTAVGPRVELAGLVDGSGPYSGPIKRKVDDEVSARAAVDDYARRGYAQIKIYSSIKPELMPFIARLAHERGLRVSGHVPAFMTAEQFVRGGADEIQHANFLFLNFLFDTVKDTRTPARFTAVAEHAAEIDPSQERVKAFLSILAGHRTVIDPTLIAFETMFVGKKGEISPAYAAIADRMPAQIRRGFLSGSLPIPAGKEGLYRDSYRSMLRMVKAAFDRGIPVVAGTDDLAGFTLARELELYVEAGIPAPEVLRIATLGAARVMKKDGERGSIEPGKMADLLLVDGDPAKAIGAVRRAEVVVKDGVLYRPAEIDAAIGVKPAS